MNFAIVAIIIFLFLLFLFFVTLIIIGLTADREKSETKKSLIPSSLTSKFPSVKTTFWSLFVIVIIAVAIIYVPQWLFSSVTYIENNTPESFDDEELKYLCVRDCNGQYHIVNGSMLIAGPVSIINTDVVWDKSIYWFDFLVKKGESAKVEITFRNRTTERSFSFIIDDSVQLRQKIEFGIGNSGFPFVNGFYSGEDSRRTPFNLQEGELVDITIKFYAPTSGNICPLELYEINIG